LIQEFSVVDEATAEKSGAKTGSSVSGRAGKFSSFFAARLAPHKDERSFSSSGERRNQLYSTVTDHANQGTVRMQPG
jgi:hypothetical protein